MKLDRVLFFTWLYHRAFHSTSLLTDLGEEKGKLRRFCSCGISWRENAMKAWDKYWVVAVEKALAVLLILWAIFGAVLLVLTFGDE